MEFGVKGRSAPIYISFKICLDITYSRFSDVSYLYKFTILTASFLLLLLIVFS